MLGILRYQIDVALSPLPHTIGLGVFGQCGVVTSRIVEEPERDEESVHFVLALKKVTTDSTIFYLVGRVLVTIKGVSLPADYGDQISFAGRLRLPHPARNPGAFDYQNFLIQQDIYATLFVRKGSRWWRWNRCRDTGSTRGYYCRCGVRCERRLSAILTVRRLDYS